jgi:arylsulfatase A-like enzyme
MFIKPPVHSCHFSARRFAPCRGAHCGPRRARKSAGCLLVILTLVLLCGAGTHPRLAAAASAPTDGVDGRPPNIVFIVLDTTRSDRMSYNGYPRLTTPNIDEFTHDAVTYRHAHSVAPWTLPSHMSMFTGLLPGRHGATWRAFATPEDMTLGDLLNKSFTLADPSQLLPERLRKLGYTTVGFSSNAWVSRRTGFGGGFDAFYEMWKESTFLRKVYNWLPPRARAVIEQLPRSIRATSEADAGDGGQVLLKLKEHVAAQGPLHQPFFLFFNFIDPHFPYSPPLSWRYAYSDDVDLGEALALCRFDEMTLEAGARPVDVSRFNPFYDAEVTYVDFMVGRLLTWLREQGYYDQALIVITSDHGEHIGERGHFSHQFSVEEELLSVPLIIKYPGNAHRGLVVDNQLVSTIDIYETLLRAAAHGQPLDGATTISQDLADMAAFSRSHLIAEEYYSLPYLRLSRQRYPDFPIEENQVTRRVVYDEGNRYEFDARDGVVPASAAAASPGRQAAAAFLQQYVNSLDKGMLRETHEPLDEATRERLRSLGYVH